jgi:hypothetical protein
MQGILYFFVILEVTSSYKYENPLVQGGAETIRRFTFSAMPTSL